MTHGGASNEYPQNILSLGIKKKYQYFLPENKRAPYSERFYKLGMARDTTASEYVG